MKMVISIMSMIVLEDDDYDDYRTITMANI